MMKLFPKNPHVPMFMGMVLVQQKKLADARQAFEKAIERSPDFLPALEQINNLDLAAKQYATALGRAQKQIEKAPKAALPHLLLAEVHLAQARYRLLHALLRHEALERGEHAEHTFVSYSTKP